VGETISVTRDGGIVTITLDRPAVKNALNGVMWHELLVAFREITASPSDRCVVLTGAGGEFCSGADLSSLTDGPPRHPQVAMREVGEVTLALHRIPQPTIAKVRGVAVGAGANLAFGCDLVVCSDTARFSEIFARRGLSVDAGGSWLLPRRVGLHRAKELAFFADVIGAAEADRMGLVNRVVPDAELDAFVDGWAERLAAGPPIALTMTKRLLDQSMLLTMADALEAEGNAQAVNFSTKDTAEAVSAFLEKRTPRFEGS
jgi:2-(1,2-epoxy-1,2-dihydrophenyl)acetyl-CoA isomerase